MLFYVMPVIKRMNIILNLYLVYDGVDQTEILIQATYGGLNFLIITILIYLWKGDPGYI